MNVTVDFPDHEIDAFVKYVFADQLPFVEMLAVRQTGLDFQAKEQERLTHIFEQRRPRWQKRSIKVTDWPKKQRPEMRIAVDSPPSGSDPRDQILGKFETDTVKRPFRGRSVAVPTEHVPRTPAGVIREAWRPKNLFSKNNAQQHGVGKVYRSKGNVYKGARNTFLIRRPGGRGTIFRRVGGEAVALYQLVPYVRITPELEFIETAERVVAEKWPGNFVDAFDRAIRTAR